MDAIDAFSRSEQKKFTTRESVNELLETNSAKYLEFLDGLSQETLGSMFETQMGTFPMMHAITFCADHTRGHVAQLDYIQTIYGDRQTHF